MPILTECATCKREGGYAREPGDKVCARCKNRAAYGREKQTNKANEEK